MSDVWDRSYQEHSEQKERRRRSLDPQGILCNLCWFLKQDAERKCEQLRTEIAAIDKQRNDLEADFWDKYGRRVRWDG